MSTDRWLDATPAPLKRVLTELDGLPTSRFERVPGIAEQPGEGVRDTFVDAVESGTLGTLAAAAAERLGRRIAGRYELRRLLGTGAGGAVYAAVDYELEQAIAVKVLHQGLQTSEEHVARFTREARAASAIGHRAVVKIFDVGQEPDGTVYMVLELLVGEALFYAIEDKSLSVRDIVDIGRQLLDGLAAAHARSIVHRDVKPENIFLCKPMEDAPPHVKLLDFGIAKCLRPDIGTSFSTMDGTILGTPHYMSPEMCLGETPTPAADLWAAAAVLYHALAGHPPFDDNHVGRLLTRIVREEPPSLGLHRSDLPGELVEAIDRALSHDPTRRFLTASRMSTALSEAARSLTEA